MSIKKEHAEEEDQDNDGTEGMISFVIDTICDGFSGESTDEKVQLQIIKVLFINARHFRRL
jgi:hypothetical protein